MRVFVASMAAVMAAVWPMAHGAGLSEAVVCIENGGQVAVEEHGCDCRGAHADRGSEPRAHKGAHCGPCVDIPVFAGSPSHAPRTAQSALHKDAPTPGVLMRLPDYRQARIAGVAAGGSPAKDLGPPLPTPIPLRL